MVHGRHIFAVILSLYCVFSTSIVLAQSEAVVSLAALFQSIEHKESISFSFVFEDLDGVQVDTTFVKTWATLKEELPNLGFQFRQESETLFLIAAQGSLKPPTNSLLTLHITDGAEPLVGASLQCPDGRIWVTDAQGKVVLAKAELPSEITIRYVGYVTERVQDMSRISDAISLRKDTMLTALAEVVGHLPPRLLKPITSINSSENATAFNAFQLPPVTLNNFGFVGIAGVNTLDGQSALPAIRGSQGSETLVELDGLPLYHIDHLFGLFSAINPQAVEHVNLFRSHYPADRGGFRGGMMDIQSIPNNVNSVQLDIDQLSAAATVTGTTGPIKVLISGRSSLGNVAGTTTFQEAGAVNDAVDGITTVTTPDFSYHDLYARLDIQPSKSKWSGTINGYTSRDEYSYGSDSREIIDGRIRPLTLEGNYLEESLWKNLGFGGSLNYKSDKVTYQLTLRRTDYEQNLNADSEFSLSNSLGSRNYEVIDNELLNTITDQQAEVSMGGHTTKSAWSAGVQTQFVQTQAKFRFRARTPLNIDRTGKRLHAFATLNQRLGKQFSANLGLRATQAFELEQAWLSPRAILTYELPHTSTSTGITRLIAGYSYTRQTARALQHENQFGQTYTILVLDSSNVEKHAAAHNFTLGVTHSTSNFRLGVEGYYRRLPGLLASLSSSIGITNDRAIGTPLPTFRTFVGEGEVVGIDIDASYERSNFSGQVAYTLSKSIQSFNAISQGIWQRAPDDRRHRFATSHTYTQGRWSGGFNYEAASGLVYNDLNAVTDAGEREEIDPNTLQAQLPDYHRVDIFTQFEQPFGKTPDLKMVSLHKQKSFSIGLRLYNALDRANVTQRQYILSLNTDSQRPTLTSLGTDVALLGRILLFEAGVRF